MQKIDVAAYIWPSYTGDEQRSRMFWGEGMGEWQTVKNSKRKTPSYYWNRKPLWGYENEADPYVMQSQIDCAADHGVNVFIYDWYWYDRRPFLEQCLDNGYLRAKNNDRVKFYLMWANHDANHLWNIDQSDENGNTVIWQGSQDRAQFEIIVHRVIEKYFSQPSYYKIDGKPVFMIYELLNLINGLGGIDAAVDALEWFRAETVRAGFPGLHLQAAAWRQNGTNLSGVDSNAGGVSKNDFERLAFDSITHYQFVHFTSMNRDYSEVLGDVAKEYANIGDNYKQAYYPHVSIGWDNNPRYKSFIDHVCRGNTPEMFEKALRMAKEYVEAHPSQQPLVTINSWNEWTETSYLEPDNLYGYGYLEAVRRVFCE
ncbi:MAG: glycoside hydrolase family 99-like domain-containing protein [Eubacteriales bacterium]